MHQLDRLAASIASDIGLDADEIALRKRFLELGGDDAALLKSLHDSLEPAKERFTAAFYDHLLQFAPLRALIGDEAGLARLRHAQSAYFSSLTAGQYDEAYVLGRLGVGVAHQRVGLDPKWYIGAYRKYLSELMPLLSQACDSDCDRFAAAVDALLKVVLFDVGLALDTYFHHEHREIAHSRSRAEQVLRNIVEGTAAATGPAYMEALAKSLATTLGTRYAIVGSCDGVDRVSTLAIWADEGFALNFGYDLAGTPCRYVVGQTLCAYPSGVAALFPDDPLLANMSAESYIGTPIFGSRGEPLGILIVMDDKPLETTDEIKSILRIFAANAGAELERMQAEEHIRHLNDGLEQRVRDRTAELESFGYSLSHDLRAPLRSIVGFSQILHEDHAEALPPEGRENLERVIAAGQRMSEIIDGMLGLFHLGAREPAWAPLDLGETARDICDSLAATQPDRCVHCVVARPLPATGDAGLLRAALENLIGNAWKYSARQAEARIEFGAESDEAGQTVYYVRDNGAGFNMMHAARLFEPFQRLHQASDYPGTGIGLATVKRIIALHGGSLSAHAEPGKGATFYFTLGTPPDAGR